MPALSKKYAEVVYYERKAKGKSRQSRIWRKRLQPSEEWVIGACLLRCTSSVLLRAPGISALSFAEPFAICITNGVKRCLIQSGNHIEQ